MRHRTLGVVGVGASLGLLLAGVFLADPLGTVVIGAGALTGLFAMLACFATTDPEEAFLGFGGAALVGGAFAMLQIESADSALLEHPGVWAAIMAALGGFGFVAYWSSREKASRDRYAEIGVALLVLLAVAGLAIA